MKIVFYVNYSDKQFNIDFKVANLLINEGHNVFFAINDEQFEYFSSNCDKSIIGLSMNNYDKYSYVNYIKYNDNINIIKDNILNI